MLLNPYATILLPVAGTLGALILVHWLLTASSGWRSRLGWYGVILAGVYACSHLLLFGWQGLPPCDIKHWPPILAIAACLVSILAGLPSPWWRRVVHIMVVIGASYVLLRPASSNNDWTVITQIEVVGAMALGWYVLQVLWALMAARVAAPCSLVGLLICSGVSAFALLLYGNMMYAQLVGVIALSLCVCAIMFWWTGAGAHAMHSLAWSVGLLVPVFWFLGHAELPGWAIPLLAVTGLTPWLTALPRIRSLTMFKRIMVTALIAILAASPLLIAGVRDSLIKSQSSGQGEEHY